MLMSDARETRRLAYAYLVEILSTLASNFLAVGIFFFTRSQLAFTTRQNLLLSAAIGGIYIIASLASHRVVDWLGARTGLLAVLIISGLIALVPLVFASAPALCGTCLAFVLVLSIAWPILEHLIAAGPIGTEQLARRITVYNLIWSTTAAASMAINGLIIRYWPAGMFWLPGGLCLASAAFVALVPIEPDAAHAATPTMAADPQLLRQRKLALMLARISVPAMYVVIQALNAMMPSIPTLQPYTMTQQTLITSGWFAVRTITFLGLGLSTFWHARPRLLLVASVAQMLAFALIVIPLTPNQSGRLATLFVGELILGVATGWIYMCSLYFGMALTAGSAESGSYHEALIGLGMTIGPATAAITEFVSPHNQPAAVAAVLSVLGITVISASVMSLKMRRRPADT